MKSETAKKPKFMNSAPKESCSFLFCFLNPFSFLFCDEKVQLIIDHERMFFASKQYSLVYLLLS